MRTRIKIFFVVLGSETNCKEYWHRTREDSWKLISLPALHTNIVQMAGALPELSDIACWESE